MGRERLRRPAGQPAPPLASAAGTGERAPAARRLQRLVGNQEMQRSLATPPGFDDPAEHGSPPAAGPGSRSEPLTAGRRGVQQVADLRIDAFYASPLNPENPLLVWTNGSQLFFSLSQAQLAAGRTLPAAEPIFAPPAGYLPAEIHWDRREGLTTGGGPLVVIARKPGEEDLEVAVSNTLEQRAHFQGLGLAGGASLAVSPERAELLSTDDTAVPLELSGAAALGALHGLSFPDGFLRYRAPGGSHDLYVGKGADPVVHLVERATGALTRSFPAGTVQAVVAAPGGMVQVEETTTSAAGIATPATINIDLNASPPVVTRSQGHASAEPGYAAARARLAALGVAFEEQGLRLRVVELQTVEEALAAGGGRGLDVLTRFRALEGLAATDPLLDLHKVIGPDDARGFAAAGGGPPLLHISEPFDAPALERAATVRHEITHVLMGATDALHQASLTRRQQADLEGALRFAARRAAEQARAGLLRPAEYGAADPVPAAGTTASWRGQVGEDPQLAALWVELLRRYGFIPDPEGTGERRGTSLADESRYSGAGDVTSGHPENSIDEFVASFTASATLFRSPFVAAVLAAEAAGNARGGRGGSYLRGLYRRAWARIDARYMPLGANPF